MRWRPYFIVIALLWAATFTPAQQSSVVNWLWFAEGGAELQMPAGTRYFRKVVNLRATKGRVSPILDQGTLDVTAGDSFTLFVNGQEVGKGTAGARIPSFDVTRFFVNGPNVIAIEATTKQAGPAGLLARLSYIVNGEALKTLVSDGTWKASDNLTEGWQNLAFADQGWSMVRVIGPYGEAGPWRDLILTGGASLERFSVPPGFKVVEVVKPPANDGVFSLINMCFDDKGRILVARERQGILLCADPDKNGVMQTVRPFASQVTHCQGMCWVDNALLVNGTGPDGVGLYRLTDTDGDDRADKVELLMSFVDFRNSEHFPHGIFRGPDGWIYMTVGNHAMPKVAGKFDLKSPLMRWPTGQMGPDQGRPNTTEDVLLPRMNDPRGQAKDKLAPGGTIWRFDPKATTFGLYTAGFRNVYDASFSPAGELFTFESDMQSDEHLPWYRPVAMMYVPQGADYVWRAGSSDTPWYYLDGMVPIVETGRGSPVGMEFYDHVAFPEKYRGACFMADWSIGIIYALYPKREGGGYTGEVEKFCKGTPMSATDVAVGPDGALYFVIGGRSAQGGVYKIMYEGGDDGSKRPAGDDTMHPLQPLSAWGRAKQARAQASLEEQNPFRKPSQLADGKFHTASTLLYEVTQSTVGERIDALNYLLRFAPGLLESSLPEFYRVAHKSQDVTTQAYEVWLMGRFYSAKFHDILVGALKDRDPFVRRKACEAVINAGIDPPLDDLWPLLGDPDHWVHSAARLVLERIDSAKWAPRTEKEADDLIVENAIIALGHKAQIEPHAEMIFDRLEIMAHAGQKDAAQLLNYLRTLQIVLVHTNDRSRAQAVQARYLLGIFPDKDWRVNRELAILLTHFQMRGVIERVQDKLIGAMLAAKDDPAQQIHYFYCMRFLKGGWSAEDKQAVASWYYGTKSWHGGSSFTPFLQTIYQEVLRSFNYSVTERRLLLKQEETNPQEVLALVENMQREHSAENLADLSDLAARLAKTNRDMELARAVNDALARTALDRPGPDTFRYVVLGLASKNPLLQSDALAALAKLETAKPKADDSFAFRVLLEATPLFETATDKWQAIEVLRRWTGRSFSAEPGDWEPEWKLWTTWFTQNFPKEPAFASLSAPTQSKYQLADLLSYLEQNPEAKTADAGRGRVVFEKSQCLRCHRFAGIGEGIGPDLTTVSKRFKTIDILDSILSPSKVISDQYRSTTVTTKKGRSVTGILSEQGDMPTVVLADLTKVTLTREEIEAEVPSLVSLMPERLLDSFTERDIADLLAFLQSEPN